MASNSKIELSADNLLLEKLFFTSIAVLAILFNLIVILSYFYVKAGEKGIHTRITLHLSVANLITGAFEIFVTGQGEKWIMTYDLCQVLLILKYSMESARIFFTTLITTESFAQMYRYYANTNKEKLATNRQCFDYNLTIGLIWCSIVYIAMLSFVCISMDKEKHMCSLTFLHLPNKLIEAYLVVIFLSPLIFMTIMCIVYRKLSLHRSRSVGVHTGVSNSRILYKDSHYAKCSFLLYLTLFLTSLPYIITTFTLTAGNENTVTFNERSYKAFKACQWWLYVACFFQPLIIIRLNSDIHRIVKKQFDAFLACACGGNTAVEDDAHPSTDQFFEQPTPLRTDRNHYFRETIEADNINIAGIQGDISVSNEPENLCSGGECSRNGSVNDTRNSEQILPESRTVSICPTYNNSNEV